ncbi:MAG: hypothetical protein Q4D54_08435 [Eubacteriales bacterium]|nr:hypothetical protein [Eubacteriales bacterium]
MKKFLAILLSVGMVFSLVACGGSADSEDAEREESKEVVESTVEEVEETTETKEITEESTESVEEENEESAFISHPTDEGYTVGNYWYFMADATGNGEEKWYVYDLVAHEIIGESDMDLSEMDPEMRFLNYIYENTALVTDYGNEGKIIDVCTGEEIFVLNENQRFITDFNWGNVLVLETQENFEGNTYSLGMVNHKGEWFSISADFISGEHADSIISSCTRTYEGKYVFYDEYSKAGESICFYICDFGSGEVTSFEVPVSVDCYVSIFENEWVAYNSAGYDTYFVNLKTEEKRESDYRGDYVVDGDALVGFDTDSPADPILFNQDGLIARYDLSAYDQVDRIEITKNNLLSRVQNEQGVWFVCLFNTDGSMAFEPINEESFPGGADREYIDLTEEKLVAWDWEGAVFVYNIATQELVNTEMPYVVKSYIAQEDMFVVEGEHPEYGIGYYLVSTDDLETLINPFEK